MGRTTRHLSYKAKRVGIRVHLHDEGFTTKTCPQCGHLNTTTNRRYKCSRCGFCAHRDVVGAINGRAKYLGLPPWNGKLVLEVTPVVGAVAAPTGVRFRPHMRAQPVNPGVARVVDRSAA